MKILEVIYTLGRGGAERFIVDLCNEFSRRGHEVTLLVIGRGLSASPFLPSLSADVRKISLNCDADGRFNAVWTMLRVQPAVAAVGADVVHCHLFALQLCCLPMLLNFRKIPFFYTVHNDAFFDAGTYLRFNRMLFKLPWVHPVAISPASAESFQRAYSFEPLLIVNGCCPKFPAEGEVSAAEKEINSLRTFPDGVVFINLARVTAQKNQLEMAEAARLCVENGIHLDIFIMGDLCDADIAEKIRALGTPYVHLVGPRDKPLSYLACADALLLPSVQEGMPISLLETCAVARPACVTPVGGMKDFVIDGKNGIVSAGTDRMRIAEMLARFCSLPAKAREKMGKRAHGTYKEHTMERCADSYLLRMQKIFSGERFDGQ